MDSFQNWNDVFQISMPNEDLFGTVNKPCTRDVDCSSGEFCEPTNLLCVKPTTVIEQGKDLFFKNFGLALIIIGSVGLLLTLALYLFSRSRATKKKSAEKGELLKNILK